MLYFRERVLRVARAETGIPIFVASIFDAAEIQGKSDGAFIAERDRQILNFVCQICYSSIEEENWAISFNAKCTLMVYANRCLFIGTDRHKDLLVRLHGSRNIKPAIY